MKAASQQIAPLRRDGSGTGPFAGIHCADGLVYLSIDIAPTGVQRQGREQKNGCRSR
jgi:hypothetical protein